MLKEIAEKDHWNEALARFGFTPDEYEYCTKDMHPELKKRVDSDIDHTALALKGSSVARYLMTDAGKEESKQLLASLENKVKQVLLHRDAVVISQKVAGQASCSLMEKCGPMANLFVFELFVKNSFIPDQKAQEAEGLLQDTLKAVKIASEKILEILCENPLWFHQMLEQLEQADNLYKEAMPRQQFPPDAVIEEMALLVNDPDWTPTASAILVLNNLDHGCGQQ